MPVVHVYLWAGRSKEQKKEIVKGITNVFTKQKVPSKAVTIIIHDISKEDWGIGGHLSLEK